MEKKELRKILDDSCLFKPSEVARILHCTGSYTVGNAIVSCELLAYDLSGLDIDCLIRTAEDSR